MALDDTIQKEIGKIGQVLALEQRMQSSEVSDLERANLIETYIQNFVPDTDKPAVLASYYDRPLHISTRETINSIGAKVNEFKDNRYNDIKEQLIQYAITQINATLKDTTQKGEAAEVLSQVLRSVLQIQEPSLQQAVQGFSQRSGYSSRYLTQEATQTVMNQSIGMAYRSAASEYLNEIKGQNSSKYTVNAEKVEKLFEDVKQGATLYQVAKQLEERTKEIAKQKKA